MRKNVLSCLVAAMAALSGLCAQGASAAQLTYQGGPIMPSVKTYLVLWGSMTDSSLSSTDTNLLTDLAADSGTTGNEFAMLPEYSTSSQTLEYSQTFGGVYTITPSKCTGSTTNCSVQDADIQTELETQITNGHLPGPTGNGETTAYEVLFPSNDNIFFQSSESGQVFCEYHSSVLSGSVHIIYGVLPDNLNLWNNGCGANASATNNEVSFVTHVLAEQITDPLITENSTAWYDNSNGEIGDICNAQQANNTINGHTYVVQKLWSNSRNACVSDNTRYSAPTADFSSSVSVNTASFSASGESGNHLGSTIPGGIASYTWDFGDGQSGNGATPSHAYAAAGTYSVTMTATDSLGFTAHATHQVTVSAPPSTGGGGGGTTGGGSTGTSTPSGGTTATGAGGGATTPASVSSSGGSATASPNGVVISGETVTCPPVGGPCVVTVQGEVETAHLSKRKAKNRKIKVANATLTLAQGTSAKVSFKLNHTGKTLLLAHGKLLVKLTVTIRHGSDAAVVSTRAITITVPKKKHGKR